jgi:hypothetical protein
MLLAVSRLYLLVLAGLVDTQNPDYVPTLILLGATVIPLAFMTFAAGRPGRWQVPAGVFGAALLFGGMIGTVVAGLLETRGYAFVVLIKSQGNVGAVEQTLFVRGLLSPAGHAAWTGLVCWALWGSSPDPACVAWSGW